MDEFDRTEKSKYNEASYNLLRLHDKWVTADRYRMAGRYLDWFTVLKTVWSELVQDVKPERMGDEYITVLTDYKQHLTKCILALKDKSVAKKDYFLTELHDFLRVLQDKTGKGGMYDDGTAFDAI